MGPSRDWTPEGYSRLLEAITENLVPEEKVIYHTGHSTFAMWHLVWLRWLVLLIAILALLGGAGVPFLPFLAIWGGVDLWYSRGVLRTAVFVVTSRRFLIHYGRPSVYSQKIRMFEIDSIEQIRVRQLPLGAKLGYGCLIVEGRNHVGELEVSKRQRATGRTEATIVRQRQSWVRRVRIDDVRNPWGLLDAIESQRHGAKGAVDSRGVV